jgi:hypothetical protein
MKKEEKINEIIQFLDNCKEFIELYNVCGSYKNNSALSGYQSKKHKVEIILYGSFFVWYEYADEYVNNKKFDTTIEFKCIEELYTIMKEYYPEYVRGVKLNIILNKK